MTTAVRTGWSSVGLKTVGDDGSLWTLADASRWLGPPQLSVDQVRALIRMTNLVPGMTGVVPVGKRRVTAAGQSGRHARVYRAEDLIRAYDAVYRVAEQVETDVSAAESPVDLPA